MEKSFKFTLKCNKKNNTKDKKLLWHVVIIILLFSSYFIAPFIPIICSIIYIYSTIVFEKNIIFRSKYLYPFLFMLLSAIIGSIMFKNWISVVFAFFIFAPYLIFEMYIEDRWSIDYIIPLSKLMIYLSIPCGLIGLYQKAFIEDLPHHRRIMSTFLNPNYYAYILELIILLTLGIYKYASSKKEKRALIYITILNFICLYLAGSRSAIFALVISIPFYFLIIKDYRGLTWSLVSVLIITALLFIRPNTIPRFNLLDDNITERGKYWKIGLLAIKESPIIGRGFLAFSDYAKSYGVNAPHAHNLYINIWVDLGLPGLASGVYMVCIIVRQCISRITLSPYKYILASILASLVATLIHGATDITVMGIQTSPIFLIFISMVSIISENTPKDITYYSEKQNIQK